MLMRGTISICTPIHDCIDRQGALTTTAGLLGGAIPLSRTGGHIGSRSRYAYLVLLLQLGAARSTKRYVPKSGADKRPIGMTTGDIMAEVKEGLNSGGMLDAMKKL